jgi:endo-beta-N-acetylglucosaminidase D
LKIIQEAKTSVALFAPAWTWEYFGGKDFDKIEKRFWMDSEASIKLPQIEPYPTTFPILGEKKGSVGDFVTSRKLELGQLGLYTNFDCGIGEGYYIRGQVIILNTSSSI